MGLFNRSRQGLGMLGALTLPFLAMSLMLEGSGGGEGGGSGSGEGGEDELFDKDRAMATIKKQREEEEAAKTAAKKATDERDELQKRLDAIEADKKKAEDADKSDIEKLSSSVADLQRKLEEKDKEIEAKDQSAQKLRTKQAFYPIAEASKAHDIEAVWALVDAEKVKYSKDGEPTNLKEIVEELKEGHPKLFESGKPAGNADGGVKADTKGSGDDSVIGSGRLRRAYAEKSKT